MAVSIKMEVPPGVSLKSLVAGFVLTKRTEGKSPKTVQYYQDNLRRFLWYAGRQGWSDDVRFLTEWQIREFLGYVGTETHRWGLEGNGSETSRRNASHSTIRHYFVVLSCFINWALREGFIEESPMTKIKVAKSKPKVIVPFSNEEISRMLVVCDYDYEHHAKFIGSRNRAIILVLLDTGIRLSELLGMKVRDINNDTGYIRVLGKGSKERVVRIGKVAQKAVWRYLMYRTKESGVQFPNDIQVESLSDYQMAELRRLKEWIYERRTQAKQEKDRAERQKKREEEATRRSMERPALFEF
jgi:site-specific recombinase XerD